MLRILVRVHSVPHGHGIDFCESTAFTNCTQSCQVRCGSSVCALWYGYVAVVLEGVYVDTDFKDLTDAGLIPKPEETTFNTHDKGVMTTEVLEISLKLVYCVTRR